MDAGEIATRNRKIARRFRPARQRDGIVLGNERFERDILPDVNARRNSTPSADICAMRRSTRCRSILKSGMP
jgi:hypothetical protein